MVQHRLHIMSKALNAQKAEECRVSFERMNRAKNCFHDADVGRRTFQFDEQAGNLGQRFTGFIEEGGQQFRIIDAIARVVAGVRTEMVAHGDDS